MQVLQNYRIDPQMRQAFARLPLMVQQSIVHSGKQVRNVQDLEQCAAHLTGKD